MQAHEECTPMRGRNKWWVRGLLRAPLILYRSGLSRVVPKRYVLIEHRGRRTGRLHQTMLEVFAYDGRDDEIFVVSGWGEKADWYRNLRAGGGVRVRRGARAFAPTVRVLGPDAAESVHAAYLRSHPLAMRASMWLVGMKPRQDEPLARQLAHAMPVLGLKPLDHDTGSGRLGSPAGAGIEPGVLRRTK